MEDVGDDATAAPLARYQPAISLRVRCFIPCVLTHHHSTDTSPAYARATPSPGLKSAMVPVALVLVSIEVSMLQAGTPQMFQPTPPNVSGTDRNLPPAAVTMIILVALLALHVYTKPYINPYIDILDFCSICGTSPLPPYALSATSLRARCYPPSQDKQSPQALSATPLPQYSATSVRSIRHLPTRSPLSPYAVPRQSAVLSARTGVPGSMAYLLAGMLMYPSITTDAQVSPRPPFLTALPPFMLARASIYGDSAAISGGAGSRVLGRQHRPGARGGVPPGPRHQGTVSGAASLWYSFRYRFGRASGTYTGHRYCLGRWYPVLKRGPFGALGACPALIIF